MYIGKINQKLKNPTCTVYKIGTTEPLKRKEDGNPFAGENFQIYWSEFYEARLEMHLA